jgi:hypothetical protein
MVDEAEANADWRMFGVGVKWYFMEFCGFSAAAAQDG